MNKPHDMWKALWQRLQEGVENPNAPARHVVLASRAAKGATARMVALRKADAQAQNLTFYTHTQANKVAEIKADPMGEVLIWDADTLFQARLSVKITASKGTPALWETIGNGARLNYAASLDPGAPITTPTAPTDPNPEAFTVLTAQIIAADLLSLANLPHKRATFDVSDGFQGNWVAP